MAIRVLHVVTYMGRGGLETMIMNYYRHIDRTKVQFDFLVHREFEADYDEEIQKLTSELRKVAQISERETLEKRIDNLYAEFLKYKHLLEDVEVTGL